MCRKNPRIPYDTAIECLQKIIYNFDPINPADILEQNAMKEQMMQEQEIAAELLQETQKRLQDAERVKAEQTVRIKNLERYYKYVDRYREDLSVGTIEPSRRSLPIGAIETMRIESKQTKVCESFSNDNYNVTLSNCKRSAKGKFGSYGYCFLKHPKIEKNQIIKWKVRVSKFRTGKIGMVIIFGLII